MISFYGLEKGQNLVKNLPREQWKGFVSKEENSVWVDLGNPTKEEAEILSSVFSFHPLAIEDCLHFNKIPKINDFGSYLYVVVHRVTLDETKEKVKLKELDVFLGKNFLVTYHTSRSQSIETVQQKAEQHPPLLKTPDLVLYEIISTNTDKYFPLLEYWDDELEKLEDRVLKGRTRNILEEILKFRRFFSKIRKSIVPQREIIGRLARRESELISEKGAITSGTFTMN